MAETDSLLKRLVSTFVLDFAAWLLETAVRTVRPLPSELPASTVAVDQVFLVTLADGREGLLHAARRCSLPHQHPDRGLAVVDGDETHKAALLPMQCAVQQQFEQAHYAEQERQWPGSCSQASYRRLTAREQPD